MSLLSPVHRFISSSNQCLCLISDRTELQMSYIRIYLTACILHEDRKVQYNYHYLCTQAVETKGSSTATKVHLCHGLLIMNGLCFIKYL